MPKANEFHITGNVKSIESKFLESSGAEVCNIVLTWDETEKYSGCAAVDFYSKKGLEKLNALGIKVGDNITVPVVPRSERPKNKATGELYNFYNTKLSGDSWAVVVNVSSGATEQPIDF